MPPLAFLAAERTKLNPTIFSRTLLDHGKRQTAPIHNLTAAVTICIIGASVLLLVICLWVKKYQNKRRIERSEVVDARDWKRFDTGFNRQSTRLSLYGSDAGLFDEESLQEIQAISEPLISPLPRTYQPKTSDDVLISSVASTASTPEIPSRYPQAITQAYQITIPPRLLRSHSDTQTYLPGALPLKRLERSQSDFSSSRLGREIKPVHDDLEERPVFQKVFWTYPPPRLPPPSRPLPAQSVSPRTSHIRKSVLVPAPLQLSRITSVPVPEKSFLRGKRTYQQLELLQVSIDQLFPAAGTLIEKNQTDVTHATVPSYPLKAMTTEERAMRLENWLDGARSGGHLAPDAPDDAEEPEWEICCRGLGEKEAGPTQIA